MKEIIFEKAGLTFHFIPDGLNKYNKLKFLWKVEGTDHEVSKTSTGYFANAEFNPKKNQIICGFKIKNKSIAGVNLPEDIAKEINDIYNKEISVRNELINCTIDKIISGDIAIDISIVGCDFPQYQAWLHNIDKELRGQEQDLMGTAINKILGEKVYSNPCDFISNRMGLRIMKEKDLINKFGDKVFKIEHNKSTLEYHEFVEEIVTNFEIKLEDAIDAKQWMEAKAAKEEKINLMKEKARITGENQLYQTWSEPCNDPQEECNIDIVSVYITPEGKFKTVRSHTW